MNRSFKNAVRHAAHRLGFNLARAGDVVRPDLDVMSLLWDSIGGSPYNFVQVGGNDGVSLDPLHTLVRAKGVPGTIVEPLPHACESLRKVWNDRPDVQILEAAVSPEDGEIPLYRFVSEDPRRTEFLSLFASLDRRCIGRYRWMLRRGERMEAIRVTSISVQSLLKNCGDSVDLLVVDIEGLDDQCVHGFLDQKCRPRLICYEHIHLAPSRDQTLVERLRSENYALLRTGWDTFAILK